ncbi:hypothetical protein BH24CHL6_BH24CHL6_17360 [soil metagenome]
MGRILGIVVVLGAVAVLGVAALNFVGGQGADGSPPLISPNPTQVAGASPSPAVTPTLAPATAEPAATLPPTIEPEPSPEGPTGTPFVIDIEEGRGHITFGIGRGSNLSVGSPRASFELGERPFYSTQLLETTVTDQISIELHRYDPADGSETAVGERSLNTNLPRVHTVRQRLDTATLDGPGIYVMRFVAGGAVQAEGWFEVTEP